MKDIVEQIRDIIKTTEHRLERTLYMYSPQPGTSKRYLRETGKNVYRAHFRDPEEYLEDEFDDMSERAQKNRARVVERRRERRAEEKDKSNE